MKGLPVVVVALIAVAAVCTAAAVIPNQNNDTGNTIVYELCGGTNSPDNPSSFNDGETVILKDAEREGYEFGGWYSDEDLTEKITSVSAKGSTKVFAKWIPHEHTVTVHYVFSDGTKAADDYSNILTYGSSYSIPSPEIAGYLPDRASVSGTVSGDVETAVTYANNSFRVTYDLDGGTNSPDNPEINTLGTTLVLSDPVKDGYIFDAWIDDDGNIVTQISEDMTVHASWSYDLTGTVITLSVYNETSHMIFPGFGYKSSYSGILEFSFLHYDDVKGYYVVRHQVIDSSGRQYEQYDSYWSDEEEDPGTWTYEGRETVTTAFGDMECDVVKYVYESDTQIQYLDERGIPYLITDENGASRTTYTLTEVGTISSEDSCIVTVYNGTGIDTEGAGTYARMERVTLTASGENFGGWYDANGRLLSASPTYTIDILLEDTVLYARNSSDHDLSFDSTDVTVSPKEGLSDVEWTYVDGERRTVVSPIFTHTFSEPGIKNITYSGTTADGKEYNGIVFVLTDKTVTRTFGWTYGGEDFSYDLDILYSDMLAYKNMNVQRQHTSASDDTAFVTYNDKYVKELAQYFGSVKEERSMSDAEIAQFVLCFVQYIPYELDSDTEGAEEYWKFPLETLYDVNGDCEDTAILYCAVVKAMGYDTALLLFKDHMASGIVLDGTFENVFTVNGKSYAYCETTYQGWNIGDVVNKNYTRYGSYFRSVMPVE